MNEKLSTSEMVINTILDTLGKKEKEKFYHCVISKQYGSIDRYAQIFSKLLVDRIDTEGNPLRGDYGLLYLRDKNKVVYQLGKIRILFESYDNLKDFDVKTLEIWILIQTLNLGEGPLNLKNLKVSIVNDFLQ